MLLTRLALSGIPRLARKAEIHLLPSSAAQQGLSGVVLYRRYLSRVCKQRCVGLKSRWEANAVSQHNSREAEVNELRTSCIQAREEKPIRSTLQLANLIGGPGRRPAGKHRRPGSRSIHPATRVFQVGSQICELLYSWMGDVVGCWVIAT